MLNYTNKQLSSKEMHVNMAVRLHDERISAGLSLDALAELTGYTKPTVQSWEKGWKNKTGENKIPTLEQLLDLCVVYNCTPEYLLCEYDCKSKQVTDVSLETGLYPENVTRLQNLFYPVLEHKLTSGANDLFLAFLNHFIANSDLINELIFNRQMLESAMRDFEEDPYHDQILDGYNHVCLGNLAVDIFKDGAFPSNMLAMQFTEPLLAYYESLNYDKEMITEIMSRFGEHFMIMSSAKIKQSDFSLSDTFADIVKSFFAEFPDIVYGIGGYDDFADFQREHIEPSRIQPVSEQIIK